MYGAPAVLTGGCSVLGVVCQMCRIVLSCLLPHPQANEKEDTKVVNDRLHQQQPEAAVEAADFAARAAAAFSAHQRRQSQQQQQPAGSSVVLP